MVDKVNLAEKFGLFSDHYSPKIVGEVNDTYVKVVKLIGDFVWHHHETEDEMFLVTRGKLVMRFRDCDVTLGPGEFIIVPHGVEHMPTASEETEIVLFEPKTVLNTGNIMSERTVAELERI
jgi:mannose-6-phosphate isomerase-like protein (cupin superfamily)